jgi:hypothetical protein
MPLNRVEERRIEEFIRRYNENHEKEHIDNSRLPAGSPMYYYCKACGQYITALPEAHFTRAPQLCEDCKDLKKEALLAEAQRRIEQ